MAAAQFEFVTVVCDGQQFAGFEQIEIRRSLQSAAMSFHLQATWPRYTPQAKAIRNGQDIEVYTQRVAEGQKPRAGAGELLLTGAVDEYDADIGEGSTKKIVLNGRSHGRDIVDCPPVDHPTLRSENKTLLGVAQDLGAEFDVEFSTDQNLDPIEKVQATPGEKLFETLERHARMEGLLIVAQPDGSVKFTRAGSQRHAGALVEGDGPVNRWSIRIAPATQRSPVVVRGQRHKGYGKDNLRQEDRYAVGNAGRRHRPALVPLEGDRPGNQLRTRGSWHHLRSFGFGNTVSPRVSSWRDQAGTLWTPGFLMAIRVPSEELDLDMVLSEVTFRQGLGRDAGTRAELVFTDPRNLGGAKPMGSQDDVTNPDDTIAGP
jgi:prophage tail gpP-like protein